MGLVLSLVILILCIRHVMNHGRPGKTATIYAGSFLAIGLLFAIVRQFTLIDGIDLSVTFLYDLATGFAFFWLIDRYHTNLLAFYLIIILGIAANLAVKFLLIKLLAA